MSVRQGGSWGLFMLSSLHSSEIALNAHCGAGLKVAACQNTQCGRMSITLLFPTKLGLA